MASFDLRRNSPRVVVASSLVVVEVASSLAGCDIQVWAMSEHFILHQSTLYKWRRRRSRRWAEDSDRSSPRPLPDVSTPNLNRRLPTSSR